MQLRRVERLGVVYYESPQLPAPHAFSTRIGGVSLSPYDTLNFGNPADAPVRDPAENIATNFDRLFDAAGLFDRSLIEVHQVHGGDVVVTTATRQSPDPRADAIVTTDPKAVLSVRVADCCPVLVATRDGRAVAAVHSGWRGTVAGVVTHAVTALCRISGASPGHLVAAVGPCIGFDAFEVGHEVVDAFRVAFADERLVKIVGGKGRVDVPGACRLQLVRAGVPTEQIDTTDQCTVTHRAEFFSHRRDHGQTGRMVAVIAPRVGPG